MTNFNHNYQVIQWQDLVIQAQELALKMPETGLSPDAMLMMTTDHLMGVLAFLKRLNVENES